MMRAMRHLAAVWLTRRAASQGSGGACSFDGEAGSVSPAATHTTHINRGAPAHSHERVGGGGGRRRYCVRACVVGCGAGVGCRWLSCDRESAAPAGLRRGAAPVPIHGALWLIAAARGVPVGDAASSSGMRCGASARCGAREPMRRRAPLVGDLCECIDSECGVVATLWPIVVCCAAALPDGMQACAAAVAIDLSSFLWMQEREAKPNCPHTTSPCERCVCLVHPPDRGRLCVGAVTGDLAPCGRSLDSTWPLLARVVSTRGIVRRKYSV